MSDNTQQSGEARNRAATDLLLGPRGGTAVPERQPRAPSPLGTSDHRRAANLMFVDTITELVCAQLRVAGVPDDATTGFSIKRFASAFKAEKADILSQDDAEAFCVRMERQAEMIVK